MAIVKTLIVKGVARFMTDAYMSTIRSGIWNGSTIQVGYGGTGVTSGQGDLYTPVFLSSNGIAPCSVEIPHTTKNFTINGTAFAVYTTYTGSVNPTFWAPTTLAGTGGYILATNSAKTGLEWVAKPAGNVTTTAIVGSSATATTLITAAQADPFYNLLEGGAVARSIQFKHGDNMTISSTTEGVITFTASNTWRNIYVSGTLKMTTATNTKALNFKAGSNITLSYLAPGTTGGSTDSGSNDYGTLIINASNQIPSDNITGSGTNGWITKWTGEHTLGKLVAISSAISSQTTSTKFLREDGTWATPSYTTNTNTWRNIYTGGTSRVGTGVDTKAMNFAATGNLSVAYLAPGTSSGQSGNANYFTIRIDAAANAVGVAGYVAAPTKASNPNQVWMTNADGAPAWRTINISSAALQLFSGAKTLAVSTWTDMAAVSTYSGTYAIQISDGTLYASGIFSVCGGTDTIIDEIPLHVSSTGATWRPYARISAGQLQMTTNEATGTSRTYTIKILKLI